MPTRKTRPWKQAFRNLPPGFLDKAVSLGPSVQLGVAKEVSRDEIQRGTYDHLGASILQDGNVGLPAESVVPPREMGIASRRNVDGWEEIHRDRPKESYSNPVDTPNWGNPDYGYHTVDLGGMRYPRTAHPARLARIEVESLGQRLGGKLIIRFTVNEVIDTTEPGLAGLLHELGNLLQENVGALDVFPTLASRQAYLGTLYVQWEILPPGEADKVVRIAVGAGGGATRRRVEERMDVLKTLHPQDYIVGIGGFERYFGARIENDLVVFENVTYGNAIYVMGIDWEANSKRARVDLLSSSGADFTRITHTRNWANRLCAEVERRRGRPSGQPGRSP